MKRKGDIIIIEDDPDDWELLLDVFSEVMDEQKYDNRVIIFEDSTMVIEYLKESTQQLFMVLSDINMPLLNGLELRESICADPELHRRCTPYIFLTTGGGTKEYIDRAYSLSAQGVFEKPSSFNDYKILIAGILGYWQKSLAPQ